MVNTAAADAIVLPPRNLISRPPIQVFHDDHLHVLPVLEPESVALVLTSPNYNVGYPYGGRPELDRLPIEDYKQNIASLLEGCHRALRAGGVLAMLVPSSINVRPEDANGQRLFFTADFVRASLIQQGWLARESVVVGKSFSDDKPMPMARGGIKGDADDFRFRFAHEVLVIASKGNYHLGIGGSWSDKPELKEALKDLWWLRPARRAHPLDPPLFSRELVPRLISLFTNEGDVVLDPNAGTGVVGVEAVSMGRQAWLIEREPSYWDRLDALAAEAAAGTGAQP